MEKAKEVFKYTLAVVIIICFFGLLGLMVFQGVPEPNSDLLYILAGVVGTMAVTVVNFYFGSSKSSEDKTRIMANGNAPK